MTLVEALVGMGLLTVVALLILTLFPKSLAEQKQLSVRSQVLHKADSEIQLAIVRKPALKPGIYPVESLVLADGSLVEGTLKVSAGPLISLRDVELILSWKERGIPLEFRQKQRVADVAP